MASKALPLPLPKFSIPTSLPRSYFLGHHAAALAKMRTMLAAVDLVIEVRDFRAPLTSRNPLLERALAESGGDGGGPSGGGRRGGLSGGVMEGRRRIVVYSKRDLGAGRGALGRRLEEGLRRRVRGLPLEDSHPASPNDENELDQDDPGHEESDEHDTDTKTLAALARPRTDFPNDAFFFAGVGTNHPRAHSAHALLDLIKRHARSRFSITGTRVLVAGMPNVGKSTLLNALRAASSCGSATDDSGRRTGKAKNKVAKTGAEPGVTRRVGAPVKILEGWEVDGLKTPPVATRLDNSTGLAGRGRRGSNAAAAHTASAAREASSAPVYVHDTPGVFVPFVPSGHAMLKLALIGAVRENLIPSITLAEYLLFRLNLFDGGKGSSYAHLQPADAQGPTTDVRELLTGIAKRMGRLEKGGGVDLEGTAAWFVQRWRRGDVGRFVLDDVLGTGEMDGIVEGDEEDVDVENGGVVSVSQARKMDKDRRRERSKAPRSGE